MPPYMIIILMVSSTAFLLVALFIIRRKNRNEQYKQMANQPGSGINLDPVEPNIKVGSLSQTPAVPIVPVVPPTPKVPTTSTKDLLELIKRFNFLSGENLIKFESYLEQNDHQKIEQLISERFKAQGKENYEAKAKEITNKLLSTLETT
ncbi:MAG: hypothetical protein P1V18_03905 [Candidatus Gracilibacteria bacterium]|nr:hypothetical protein [Candidatus Gracilibacteria bacterium]